MSPGEQLYRFYIGACEKAGRPAPIEWAKTQDDVKASFERAAERVQARRKPALKPRRTLPGDPRAEWLYGWWLGLFAGSIIGGAFVCMVWWSQR